MKIILLCFLGITYFESFAVNYYVSSKKGHKRFNGLTPSTPKNKIQDAADLTKPGDTVFVMDGSYTNDCTTCNVVDVPRSGAKDKYIVYRNYNNHRPKIKFNGWNGFSIRNGVSYIKIIGFEIIGNNKKVTLAQALKQPKSCGNKKGKHYDPKFNGNGIVIDGRGGKRPPHHIVVADNIVHDCGGGGLGAIHCDYIIFEDNLVYNNNLYNVFGTSGIALYQFWNYDHAKGYHNILRRNRCYNNRSLVPWHVECKIMDGNGIIIDDFRNKQNGSRLGKYTGRTLVENNVCWFNGGTGIHTFQSDHIDIVNNTAYCNSQTKEFNIGQILAGLSNDIRIVNNILVAEFSSVLNSNYANTNFTYANNMHYNVTYPKTKATVTNSTCIDGLNPQFIKPENSLKANFGLKSISPAINRGNLILYSLTDFNRNKRTQKPDIGAHEVR